MNVAIVFGVVLLLLFGLAYTTKRRFGVLGLALAAGSMLSGLWAETLTPVVRDLGFGLKDPSLITLVSVALVLLPAVVLLFSGPSYQNRIGRVIGALLFTSLAFMLLIEPLESVLVLQAEARQVYEFFASNQVYIVTIGLIVAIVDLLSVHTTRKRALKH